MRHICFLTGSRGEWGYIRPLLRVIESDPALSYSIIATNMHLLPEFGMTVNEIEQDGFFVAERIYMTLDGYNALTMTKSLAVLLNELPGALHRLRPDILLLAGDRGEQLMGAIAGTHLGIVVAHIQAGELSGNIDGVVRHAITKLAHIHFAANEEFADRVKKMGEQEFRVFNTGAPQLDELVSGTFTDEPRIREKYRLEEREKFLIVVQHPVTEEEADAHFQIRETLAAVKEINLPVLVIYPNADAGSELIRSEISRAGSGQIRFFRNLPREDYLGLLRLASAIVGNSSSGILEAPSFRLPAVNIGRRQNRRPQAANVLNCGYSRQEILKCMKKAVSDDFRKSLGELVNPYGAGQSAGKIIDVLKTIMIDERLINKKWLIDMVPMEKLIVEADCTLKEAMERMTEIRKGFLLVLNKDRLIGLITDGDVRRSILKETLLSSPVVHHLNTDPLVAFSEKEAIDLLTHKPVSVIPLLHENRKVVGIALMENGEPVIVNRRENDDAANMGKGILVIIPARGGSKRIPNKNLEKIGGYSLVGRAVMVAQEAFDDAYVLVSTDDAAIAKEAERLGGHVPWMRPDELSGETAGTFEVVAHAVNWALANLKNLTTVVLLEPTSPLRRATHLQEAVAVLKSTGADSVVGVCEVPHILNPEELLRITPDQRLVPYLPDRKMHTRLLRGKQEKVYVPNGIVYAIRVQTITEKGNLYGEVVQAYVVEWKYYADIDEPVDLLIAESKIKLLQ